MVEFYEKRRKINGGGHFPAAHNGLVAGSNPLTEQWNLRSHDVRVGSPHQLRIYLESPKAADKCPPGHPVRTPNKPNSLRAVRNASRL
ncbi:hypothetical protein ABIB73_002407 [Bradyrhizobium sp. F1.4.3]|uniref:hypothetical protein n=1 Tax=Bradyrhizobium sp. F1.4.3 TaxID=3156356 RepID=UPI003396B209